jgi:choline dehydrogenase-like flavoprotein
VITQKSAMLLDARDQGVALNRSAQVMIVGAGPVGLTLARELAGYDVLLVESGGFEPSVELDELCVGESVGLPYPVQETRSRGVGGSLSRWAGWIAPFDADDFTPHPQRHHSAWPIGADVLQAYFERAARRLNLGDLCFDAHSLAGASGLPLPLDAGIVRPTAWRLGTPTWRFGEADCEQLASVPGLTLLTHAHVVELDLGRSGGSVQAVTVRTLHGREGLISPDVLVLACGGLETARLLLNSDRQDSRGVGNSSGLVGRCFMEHPHITLNSIELLRPDLFVGSARPQRDAAGREYMLNFAVDPEVRCAIGILNGRVHAFRTPLMTTDSVPRLGVFLEQAPNLASRVTLSTQRDKLGLRTLLLDWRLSDAELSTFRQTQELFIQAFEQTHAGRRAESCTNTHLPLDIMHSNHHLGTTRMSMLRDDGVVNINCRAHDIENMYMIGGNVFPTSSWANPTFMLLAMTFRLGDHLLNMLGA